MHEFDIVLYVFDNCAYDLRLPFAGSCLCHVYCWITSFCMGGIRKLFSLGCVFGQLRWGSMSLGVVLFTLREVIIVDCPFGYTVLAKVVKRGALLIVVFLDSSLGSFVANWKCMVFLTENFSAATSHQEW